MMVHLLPSASTVRGHVTPCYWLFIHLLIIIQVPSVDPRGNVVPSWKRHLLAKQMAEKAEKEEQQKKKRQEEEARQGFIYLEEKINIDYIAYVYKTKGLFFHLT